MPALHCAMTKFGLEIINRGAATTGLRSSPTIMFGVAIEGRANIYVAPAEQGTTVSVNTRYEWNFRAEYHTYLYAPLYNSQNKTVAAGRRSDTRYVEPVTFNTNQVGGRAFKVQCVFTGKFENDILDLVEL